MITVEATSRGVFERDMIASAQSLEDGSVQERIEYRATNLSAFDPLVRSAFALVGSEGAQAAIQHEVAHADAAKLVGGVLNYFGVLFFPPRADAEWGSGIGVQPIVNLTIDGLTPLQAAAVYAHPFDPSRSDLAAINQLGYDIQTVAEEALWVNSREGLTIPVPLSFHA